MQRYYGAIWEVLPTTIINKTQDYTPFDFSTSGFSPFAITASKDFASVSSNVESTKINNTASTTAEKSIIGPFIVAFLIAVIIAVGYVYFKKHNN